MAVAKKNKRKILVDEGTYYWYVRDDDLDHMEVGTTKSLTIVSEDKRFLVTYPLDQHGEHNFIVVVGQRFGGTGDFGGTWQRVVCPRWDFGGAVTPALVRQIVLWALTDKENIAVTYRGDITTR